MTHPTQGVHIFICLASVLAMGYLVYVYTKSRKLHEGMADSGAPGAAVPVPDDPAAVNMHALHASPDAQVQPGDPFPKDRLVASDLLPKDASNELWSQVSPAGQGDVDDKNYLNAGHLTGINTVMATMRNPNLQLRSEPPNPRARVSVWNESTIEPDLNRRPFEIN
jgi:hypothetical protein